MPGFAYYTLYYVFVRSLCKGSLHEYTSQAQLENLLEL